MDLPTVPSVILLLLLFFLALGMIAWAIYSNSLVKESNAVAQNPFCFLVNCPNASVVHLENGLPETTNFCVVNAPTEGFQREIERCELSSEMVEQFKQFLTFYDTDYIKTCGPSWKGTNLTPHGLEGERNNFLVTTVACADKLIGEGYDLGGPNLDSLRSMCGGLCQ